MLPSDHFPFIITFSGVPLTELVTRDVVEVVVNTSLNTAGRPMVDDPRDALECFGSAPLDALAIGPYLVRRRGTGATALRTDIAEKDRA